MKKFAKDLPVIFSSGYIEYGDLPVVLSSADIGLMFYESIDSNFTEILFSSNKLTEYLKAGLPVISSDFPSLRQFIKDNAIGTTIATFDELPGALESLNAQIQTFRENALTCYEKFFRFERYFENVHAKLTNNGVG